MSPHLGRNLLRNAELFSASTNLIGIAVMDSNRNLVYLNKQGRIWLQKANLTEANFIEILNIHHKNASTVTNKFSLEPFHFEVRTAEIDNQVFSILNFVFIDSKDFHQTLDENSSAEKVDDLVVDLQMKRLVIDRKEYELGLLRSLIDEVSGFQELQTITSKFIQFCCNHFLFSQAFYFDLRPGEEVKITSLYPDRGRSALETKWEYLQIFLRSHRKKVSNLQGLWSLNKSEVMHFLNHFESIPISDVLTYPLNINGKEIGSFLFATRDGHHGFSSDELDLLRDLIEMIKPIINNALLLELSLTDELSGLRNRRMFDLSFKAEINSAKSTQSPLSIIVVDIDFFKKINDTYGHSVGDQAIQHLAKVLKNTVRQTDSTYRYGGEEFVVLVRGDINTAIAAAKRFESALKKAPLVIDGDHILPFTISQGLAQYSPKWTNTQFFELADKALYKSKHDGRNRFTIAEDTDSERKIS